MKILLYSNQGLAPRHLGIELETIENLKADGHELHILKCDNQLEGCFFNPCHNLLGCAICETRTHRFHQKIGVDQSRVYKLEKISEAQKFDIPFFENIDELMNFEFDGVNIGRGVASSIISLRRNFEISSHTEKDFIAFQTRMAINVYLNFKKYVELLNPEEIYLFNGRFAECHPILGLAKKYNLRFKSMEVSSSKKRYEIYDNHLPHSIEKRIGRLEKIWNSAVAEERIKVAKSWFEKRRAGTNKIGIVFTGDQNENELPKGFDSNLMNIAIFNSSEDEMKVIEEWQHDIFENQNQVIEELVKHFANHPKIHFYLRVHPNLGKVDNAQSRGIKVMNYPNLTIIPSSDSVDTYALMQACDKTISFGSTTGIEATYWGKPSILFGKSFYQTLDCVYHPANFPELFEITAKQNLKAKPKANTYKHAFYVQNYGIPFKQFEYEDKNNSYFQGEHIKRTYPKTIFTFFRYLINFKKWFRYTKIVKKKNLWNSDIRKLR